MLFDPRPKTRREDLFDREGEIVELKEAVSKNPLTVLLGIRRIGKTSVLRVALNELGAPYVYLDARLLEEEGFSRFSLFRLLSDAFTDTASRWSKILDYLRNIRGVRVLGVEVELDWSERSLTIGKMFAVLNRFAERESEKGFVIVAFDEAQLLRFLAGGKGRVDFRSILAYAFDNLRNLRIVLTGSEVGLLLNMLRLDDPSSPLYGRFARIIRLERFDRETSHEFLRRGFEEVGMKVSDEVIEKVYEKVDGIVGWLTYFGYMIVETRPASIDDRLIEEVAVRAAKLVERELDKILRRSKNYAYILKAISLGVNTWSGIKRAVEAWAGRPLDNSHFTRYLRTLEDLSIIGRKNRRYFIIDPLVNEYCKRYL